MSKPHQGDTYRCDTCGMEIEVKTPCGCESGDPIFACCGTSMNKS